MAATQTYDETTYQARRERQRQESLRAACLCAKLCDELRGRDIVVLDLTSITPIFDYFVIATATNPRQSVAIAEEVRKNFKQRKYKLPGLEGMQDSSWSLQDFGELVLHVFLPEARDTYDLEGLWADAQRVDWKALLASGEVQVDE